MFELVVLLVIAFPIMALIGLVMALATRDRLRNLERSLARLERQVAAISAGAPAPPQPDTLAAARVVDEIVEPFPAAPPVTEPQPSPSPPPTSPPSPTRPSTPAPQRPS